MIPALLLLACEAEPRRAEVQVLPGGIELRLDAPARQVTVRDSGGAVVVRHRLAAPAHEVWVDLGWDPGADYTLEVTGRRGGALRVPVRAPDLQEVVLSLEAPLGQDPRPLPRSGTVEVATVEGATLPVGIVATAVVPGVVQVQVEDRVHQLDLPVAGARAVAVERLAGPAEVSVVAGDQASHFTLRPVPLAAEAARERLVLREALFPADPTGRPDPAWPRGRVTLPARWWEALLRRLDLGFRPADSQAPWAWMGVVLENRGEAPLNVVLRLQVEDAQGPAHAFRPRLREADGDLGAVAALVRVPAGETARAALPLFVDRAAVHPGVYQRRLEVRPLGASEPLWVDEEPLVVRRGSGYASLGFAGSVAGSLAGLGLLALRLRRWLAEAATSDLTTIALFAGLQLVVSIAGQVIAGPASVLGPFSPLITGLVDDAVRTCLLAVLVTLLPRPGIAALAVVLTWLLRGLATGGISPVDLLFVGAAVAWLEGALWLAGVTRGDGRWRERPPLSRGLRLATAFVPASALQVATGLVVHVVLYRLFFADWYVLLLLGVQGVLYPAAAVAAAVGLGASLRRVEA